VTTTRSRIEIEGVLEEAALAQDSSSSWMFSIAAEICRLEFARRA
jgi:hypothetical protein